MCAHFTLSCMFSKGLESMWDQPPPMIMVSFVFWDRKQTPVIGVHRDDTPVTVYHNSQFNNFSLYEQLPVMSSLSISKMFNEL